MMKVLLMSLEWGKAAHDLAFLAADEEVADIIVVVEPNKRILRSGR